MPFSYLLLYEFVESAQSTERETINYRLPFLMSGTSTFTLLKVSNSTKWNVRLKRWSLNVLDRYYDTEKSKWLTERQNIKGRILNMSLVLDNIMEVMRASGEEKELNQPKGTENVQKNNGLFRNTCNMPFYQRMSLVIFSYIMAFNTFFY